MLPGVTPASRSFSVPVAAVLCLAGAGPGASWRASITAPVSLGAGLVWGPPSVGANPLPGWHQRFIPPRKCSLPHPRTLASRLWGPPRAWPVGDSHGPNHRCHAMTR